MAHRTHFVTHNLKIALPHGFYWLCSSLYGMDALNVFDATQLGVYIAFSVSLILKHCNGHVGTECMCLYMHTHIHILGMDSWYIWTSNCWVKG